MKKTRAPEKKLVLARHTLRTLDLRAAAGGGIKPSDMESVHSCEGHCSNIYTWLCLTTFGSSVL